MSLVYLRVVNEPGIPQGVVLCAECVPQGVVLCAECVPQGGVYPAIPQGGVPGYTSGCGPCAYIPQGVGPVRTYLRVVHIPVIPQGGEHPGYTSGCVTVPACLPGCVTVPACLPWWVTVWHTSHGG